MELILYIIIAPVCCALAFWFFRGCPITIHRHVHNYEDPAMKAEREAHTALYKEQLEQVAQAEAERTDTFKELAQEIGSYITEDGWSAK